MRGKRAQFFILAAVILSAVIISLGMTANYVRVNREPENFYDFSYEIKKESGAVIDYQIYNCDKSGVPFPCDSDDDGSDEKLRDFVNKLATEIRDEDPDANFIFIYGNDDKMKVRNYGGDDADAGGRGVPGGGRKILNKIVFYGGQTSTKVEKDFDDYEDREETEIRMEGRDSLDVEILDQKYTFHVSKHKKVIFILQRETEDESFIAVE